MKRLAAMVVCVFLGNPIAQAQQRVFTNADGKTVQAELINLEGEIAVLKLSNGSSAKVPLTSLSVSDQSFVAGWWKENKDKLKPSDVALAITKKTKRIDRRVKRSGGTGGGNQNNVVSPVVKKETIDDFHYVGDLKSYTAKNVSDITVTYTIYKRVSVTDKDGSRTSVEEIDGTDTIRLLEANGSATFETDVVRCEDSSQTGGNKPRELKRETVLGVVMHLSAGGEDFLTMSHPDNFEARLEELLK